MSTRSQSGIELSGYDFIPLREGGEFTLYRGWQGGNPSPILVVALAAEHPSPQSLRRLEHEYSLAAELDPGWAAKPLALSRYEGRPILVLKDPGGEPLDQILERGQGQPLDLTRALRIAIGLTAALGQVHRHGLVHKDIKPENVLVNDANSVWLTGFGIASRLHHERQPPVPPEIISGTLAYMAPEQTGCMNRSVDARSDFYSLGVTLYRMLTDALPFAAADPLEWVHCHVARQPVPPSSRAAVPEPLSSLTMKLLAKNAEERYQTAEGLEADLRHCLAEWESLGRIDQFPLGKRDSSDRLLIPEKLYGREVEIDALIATFNRVVASGIPEIALVSGYSGVGKSSLVNELHKVLVPRGLFAAGKFDHYKSDIPYATLAQAFQTLVRQILVKSRAEMDRWRYSLADAVGPNGHVIVNLVPELELIIGEQPPLPDLPPQDAQNRFQMVLLRLLNVFARKEHPLALFLDDLQWVDSATLDFLEYLFIHSGIRYLLVIGAYRENEVSQGHPLARAFDTIRAGDVRVQEIVLAPLDQENTETLVAEALHCQRERAQPLAQLLMEKTGGNPFFTIRFLTALTEEGLLVFDTGGQLWRWDTERIREKNYSDNVVHLMTDRLKSLSPATREALKELACLGNIAEIRLMDVIRGETAEALHATLWEAVYAGIVFRLESAYKFLHDSIQEAAYALIPEELRAERHLRIARLLVANLTPDELGERLFEIANQFNRSATLLTDPAEASQVAAIHLRAGRRAKASGAYESAHAHLMSATALLNEYNWANQYDSTFETWMERAECEFLVRNDDQSKAILVELLERARSIADQAAVYRLRVLLHIMRSEIVEAVACARLCFHLFAIEIPQTPTQNQVQAEFDALWRTLGPRQIEELLELPLMRNHELEAAMRVLAIAVEPCYFIDLNQFCVLLFRMTLMSIENGISGPTAYACAALGAIMGDVFHSHRDGYRFSRLACDLVEKYGFIEYQARVYLAMSLAAHWTEPIGSAIEFNRLAYKRATESGDLTFAAHTNHQYLKCLLLRNDSLDVVWRESERVLDAARDAGFRDAEDLILNEQRFVAAMQDRTPAFAASGDPEGDEEVYEATLTDSRMPLMVCLYWTLKLKARFLFGDLAGALEALRRARRLVRSFVATIGQLDYSFYSALTVTALFENGSDEERSQWREHLAAQRDQLREWAETYPPTFADKYTLVLAEIARIEGRDVDAMRLYEQAIHLTRENGFIQNEALAHEVAARFYAVRGVETVANTYLRHARNCYDRWGAKGKVAQFDARHPRLQEEATAAASFTATIGTPVRQLDVESVVKASQALSSEIVLPRLIETLMRLAVEHAGAERGLLILLRGDEPQIEAEVTTGHERVAVTLRRTAVTPSDLPQSALHYVIRTRQRVLLDDASVGNLYSEDEYLRQKRTRSVLCVPIVTQTKLVGALYLENNLTPRAFTPDRVTVLELLASQAAVSVENARLYSDLQRGEAFLAEGQNISHTGSFGWNVANGEIYWSAETYKIFEHDPAVKPTLEMILPRIHPDDRNLVQQTIDRVIKTKADFDLEHRLLMADGSVKHLHVLARVLTTSSEKLEYVGAVTDVTAAKQAEERLRRSEADLLEAQRISQTGSWKLDLSAGTVTASPQMFRIYGIKPDEEASTFDLWFGRTHLEDQKRMLELFERSKIQKTDYAADYRIVLPDGVTKHIHTAGHPVLNEAGDLVEFVGTNMDVTERVLTSAALEKALQEIEQRNEALRASERDLNLIINTIPALAWSARPDGSADFFNQHYLEFVGLSAEQVKNSGWTVAVHPDDLNRLAGSWQSIMSSGKQGESEARLRRFDGEYRWFLFRADPLRDESGNIVKWFGINTDIEDRKRAEDALRRSEGYLTEAQRLTRTGSWAWNAATRHRAYWSPENYRMFGFDPELGLPSDEALSERIHPEDRDRVCREAFPNRAAKGSHFDIEYRIVLPDGAIKHLHSIGDPVLNESGDLVEFIGTTMDITERRQAEEKIREQELELRQIMDAAPQFLFVLGSDGSRLYANQSVLEFRGQTVEEWQKLDFRERFHPDDAERMAREREQALSSRSPFETEARMLRHDGKYRWFLFRYKPLKDQLGRITRWVVPAIDIDDLKRSEERLQHENIALREEIDKASMFEEIVGTSPALQTVLSRVSKVAATDSTVLITGETGTGKELVARAIHRRSQRSSFAFVSVNCAAIPRDLIASELFGHEKGSFTGATQRRLGRFELAERGTIFLDEVGELPAETQIALLRVLQEHEFERVGGAGTIRTDVRVIAATNRDLEAAIEAGLFRSDLFYRLNVFPIEMPPLRERREDVPMLVEYFIDRYARKAGKTFQALNKNSLDLLQSYPWPGNIRELQNVIERSVIVCETGTFSVDKSWLSRQPLAKELSQKQRMPLPAAANSESALFKRRPSAEKAVIENALRECAGRVYGPSGAAARLGIPRTTLENKIRSLKINKNRFKASDPTENN